jgi:hypothetical protein
MALFLMTLLTAACADRSLEPESLDLDRVACAQCRMLISRLYHAAQAVYADADTRFYDDVGCLATDDEARAGRYQFYVHTAVSQWTDVADARFVLGSGARTPMGYDVIALGPGEQRPGTEDLRAMTWDELQNELGQTQ